MNSAAILLFILGFVAWFWFDTQRSQEMANEFGYNLTN